MPAPPATVNAPVVALVDAVVAVTAITPPELIVMDGEILNKEYMNWFVKNSQ